MADVTQLCELYIIQHRESRITKIRKKVEKKKILYNAERMPHNNDNQYVH